MFGNKIYKLRDIKTFREYEKKFKKEKQKIENDAKWIWLKLLKIPEKHKRYLYERLGINKLYNLKVSRKINIGEKYSINFNLTDDALKEDRVLKIIEKYIDEFLDTKKRNLALDISSNLKKQNITLVSLENKYYPESLKNIYDYPLMFFAKGNLKHLLEEKIAIVGARNCSLYGINMTRKISKDLSSKGYIIVSGLAIGIDRSAHISASGRTIAVLGTGLSKEVFYPKQNLKIYEDILKKGGLVISEHFPNEGALKYNFPKRNRIIAGLASSVIITEAKKRSGSLITAEFATDLGKEVYTIPGDILSKKYDGNNELLKDGAIPIISCNDLDEYFNNLNHFKNTERKQMPEVK